jgi:hypothetical protein
MKTISITRANKINQQSDEITVGLFAVIDDNSLLAVRTTAEDAHAVAGEIEDEHDRETDVYLVTVAD